MRMGLPRAAKFPEGLAWFNVDRPLQFGEELQGRVVVLDFWTYCCINCVHVIPDLAYLEEKYRHQPVEFIGVHSNKYTNEADPENIRQAILRLGITHPVVVDENHRIWNEYAVRAWPTLIVVGPTGHIFSIFSGERHREDLDLVIQSLLEFGRREGVLAEGPLPVQPEQPHARDTGLAFPGKVLADAGSGRLFIADSNHHRVLVTDFSGEILDIIGNGERGFTDQSFGMASLHNPQGMALFGNVLYIADTDNHAVRRADLAHQRVDTITGTGEIGYDRRGGKVRGPEQPLNSPWDLAFMEGLLYIAMAGLHQIWTYDPASELARSVIGTGRENITDNPAERSALAQPSGLSVAGRTLYFADSETSAVRKYDPDTGLVETLVGQGLFIFGDADGPRNRALLQHPLGVAAAPDAVYVADTYNHKIRKIDLAAGQVSTVAGTGEPGAGSRNTLEFYEPGGVALAGDDLFIADTNNDRLIQYQLRTGQWQEILPRIEGRPFAEAA